MRLQSSFKIFLLAACVLTGLVLAFSPPAAADPAADAASVRRIVRPMAALDAVTLLQPDGTRIILWGIKPVQSSEAALELKALDLMDELMGPEPVNCRVMAEPPPETMARCTTHSNADLGLELLRHGYVVVDRRQTLNSDVASTYAEAQEQARVNEKGIWRFVKADDGQLAPNWSMLMVAATFGGLLLVAMVSWRRLQQMESLQRGEFEKAQRKETMLLTRERYVLISTLEGELSENKNKIEAFLTIYGDMLRDLKNTEEVPKYQKGGDIVQKYPSMSKTVFEANLGKLSLLDINLAGQLSKLYAGLSKEQEYISLEPNLPLDTAVKLVEKVLRDAEEMLLPIRQALEALESFSAKKMAKNPPEKTSGEEPAK